MKCSYIVLACLATYSFSAMAQRSSKTIYDQTGFGTPTETEYQSIYQQYYDYLANSTRCREDAIKLYMMKNPGRPIPAMGLTDNCNGGRSDVVDAQMRWDEDPFRSFYGSFVNGKLASYGNEHTQSTMFNAYKIANDVPKKPGISCYSVGAPGNTFGSGHGDKLGVSFDKFIAEHHRLINAGDTSVGSLEKLAKDGCGQFASVATQMLTEISSSGATAVRNIEMDVPASHALPLLQYSVTRNADLSQDFIGSTRGSSNGGADAIMKELEHELFDKYYQAYDGNRFANILTDGNQPNFRMRGSLEGNTSEWNEKKNIGSNGVLFWELCVVDKGPGEIQRDPASGPGDIVPEGHTALSLVNENVQIELPDNVVSPFPLTVSNGHVTGANVKTTDAGGFDQPVLDKSAYFYGPRNSELSTNEKASMVTAATAMKNKANQFVDAMLADPGKKMDLEASTFYIAACSNHLRNQPGFKNWQTGSTPEARDPSDRISFQELSDNRVEANYVVMKELIKEKIKIQKDALSKELKSKEAQLASISPTVSGYQELANRVSYLKNQIITLDSADVEQIKMKSVTCGGDDKPGVAGPTPYWKDLVDTYSADYEATYGSKPKWPKYDSNNPSIYYTELHSLSKNLKKLDVQKKKTALEAELAILGDSPEDKMKAKIYRQWIDQLALIAKERDGTPGYLNVPLINLNPLEAKVDVFPCDPTKPSDNVTCKIAQQNSQFMNKFKVESFVADVQLNTTEPDQNVLLGWKNEKPPIPTPNKIEYYYAAATCLRKYKETAPSRSSGGNCPPAQEITKQKKCESCGYSWGQFGCFGSQRVIGQ